MRFRRRRGPRLQWFPSIGTELDSITSFGDSPNGRAFTLTGLGAGQPSLTLDSVLTFDQPTELAVEQAGGVNPALIDVFGLADWQSQAWRLRRVVGKCFIGATITNDQAQHPPAALLVGAGLMVRHVNEETGAVFSDANPLAIDNVRDPWIWRRVWILSTGAVPITNDESALQDFPLNTAKYGSVQDGPHVDQKTNRIIGSEERLVFSVTAQVQPLPVNVNTDNVGHVYGYFDYRLLGSVMKQTNRRNASR